MRRSCPPDSFRPHSTSHRPPNWFRVEPFSLSFPPCPPCPSFLPCPFSAWPHSGSTAAPAFCPVLILASSHASLPCHWAPRPRPRQSQSPSLWYFERDRRR